jgi:two-component system sensor histidine kinase BaeS
MSSADAPANAPAGHPEDAPPARRISKIGRVGLRARLVAGFVVVSVVATLLAALLTIWVVHGSFADYLDRRAADATVRAALLAQETYVDASGRWQATGLDLLAHELALTGYDFRLSSGSRVLLDTTRPRDPSVTLALVGAANVRGPLGTPVARLETFALPGGGSTPADADFRRDLDRAHLVAALIAAALAIAIGLAVAGRLAGPLRRLASSAARLGRDGPGVVMREEGPPEVRAVANALTELAADLDRQQRSRRQLAQDLAHELRTPLTLVQSRIEAMQDGVVPFDADGLAALHMEVLRLSRLISQIETLAEAEARPRPLVIRTVALDVVAGEHRDGLAPSFEHAGLALRFQLDPAPALADLDATRQIIGNLLSNALKYTPKGGTVVVETRHEAGTAVLVVTDTGPGIDASDPDRVFDRFFRTAGARARDDGAGLGLAIARQLAVAQGGSLDVASSGAGAAFTLRLPLAATPHTRGPVSGTVKDAASRRSQ